MTLFCPLLVVLMLVCWQNVKAQEDKAPKQSYTTSRVEGDAPIIDGQMKDQAWDQVPWSGNYTQQSPEEGKAPSQDTKFKILYDAKNLYVLFRLYDKEPDKIVRRMSRRDGFDGDWIEINIDSYGDKRTAFSFTASASGVKGDEYISNDGNNWDPSWDPIWYLRTSIDSEGWVAEMRIPLSQLRFADKPVHTWGIQSTRLYFRNEERDLWQFVPQKESGWVRHFGELHGLEGIKPQKQLEIQPYIVGKIDTHKQEEGNPFKTGSKSDADVGVDGKIGLTSDVTLDFTINPDFGQVEADPSQVNLSAFRIFFREQRPFFIEGNNILDFGAGQSVAGGYFNSDNLFYSRRIGRPPRYSPDLEDGEYIDQPRNTKMLGAVKLTGKNKNGFSFGLLESVTRKETAEIDNNGRRRKEVVEPFTNYLVARVQQDFNEGNTILGGMVTSTNRSIQHDHLDFLRKNAYSAGLDFKHHWKDRMYYVNFRGVFSRVEGSEEAIRRTQEASERFYQRPDNSYSELDTTRTSLSGSGSTLSFGKQNGDIVFQTGATYRSPGLELNDAGFLVRADHINQWAWAQYRKLKPFKIFRSLRWNVNEYLAWDFSGVNTYRAFNTNVHMNFKNFWRLGTGGTISDRDISNADLRGGPSIRYPGQLNQWIYIGTDSRKKLRFDFEHWNTWGFEGYKRNKGIWSSITYRPADAISISLQPNVNWNNDNMQYVTTKEFENESRYIVASIDQKTYRLSCRITYNINPNLSIQYWGQPFVTRGEYSNFKMITDSDASEFENRYHAYLPSEIQYHTADENYSIVENSDSSVDYQIDNPNFDFAQFRSNMVLRWEYKPGSTLFVVWTQERTDSFTPQPGSEISFRDQYSNLFDVVPHNVFLIKYTYRFVR